MATKGKTSKLEPLGDRVVIKPSKRRKCQGRHTPAGHGQREAPRGRDNRCRAGKMTDDGSGLRWM